MPIKVHLLRDVGKELILRTYKWIIYTESNLNLNHYPIVKMRFVRIKHSDELSELTSVPGRCNASVRNICQTYLNHG